MRTAPPYLGLAMLLAIILPEHVKARDAHVQPHRLEPYDQLKEQADE
jgi:hypothetical protein